VKLNHDVTSFLLRLPLPFFVLASVVAFKPDNFQLFMRLPFQELALLPLLLVALPIQKPPRPAMIAITVDKNIPSMPFINAMPSSIVMHIIAVTASILCLAISVTLQKPVTKAAFICHHLDSVLSSILLCTLECMMSTIKRCNDAQISVGERNLHASSINFDASSSSSGVG
jgi:hypothetical protein